MNKELKPLEAFEELSNECRYAFGQTGNGNRVRKDLFIIEKSLKALEIIKDLFDIEIDLRDEKQSSFISLYSKGDRKFICLYTIGYDKAKLLKEVLL